MQHGYLELKLSWELFKKGPETLSEPERDRLDDIARKQDSIEQRILASAASANVVVPAATVKNRLDEIRARYPANEEFILDMARSDLDEAALEQAVERDLRIEAVLEKVASSSPPVSAVDAEIYYRLHPEAFDRPEARRLRHILITFNTPQEKAKAIATLESLRSTLKNPAKFAEAALRHSQCPTAMEGGQLGTVKRNQLYAELEPAAFALSEGEISAVLASPIGLHLLRCDEILPSGMLPFDEVCERIIARLGDKRRREAQREWIKSLPIA
ncbi:MAG: PpiC-type peptidyl-prolyl cis-trans isomerase [Proteobacteria bacterium]|nr:PpiC-type peptidyl-prolyl cis-trans isomerase [Pseudomonadota bacterium]